MKGGKDEEKVMSPMFPRLHVGDQEKGGPRAPPRNKMALYEQLSIPSQRFSSGSGTTMPTNHNNAAPLVPVATSSQRGEQERIAFPPYQIPPTPAESDDNAHSSDGMYLRTKQCRPVSKSVKSTNYRTSNAPVHLSATAEYGFYPKNSAPSNAGNDNDFSVPTFIKPGMTPLSNKDQQTEDRERLTPTSPNHPSHSTETSGNSAQKAASATCNSSTHLHSAQEKHLKRTNTTDLWSRQHVRNHNEENLESVTSKDCAERLASYPSTCANISEPAKHIYGSSNQRHRSSPFDDLGGSRDKGDNGHLRQQYGAGFLAENITHSNGILAEPVAPMGKGNILLVRSEFPSRASLGNDHESCNEHPEDQVHRSLEGTDIDRIDDASETSMVDSMSCFDISPDDVVGVIGQKHFWKARRAIVNQQKLFAVQVFELHRLIKVQKLIAGAPHLLLEDTGYSTKPFLDASPTKIHPVEYLHKSPPQIVKKRAEAQKPNQITECASENPMAKAPLPSVSGGVDREHVNQQSSHGQHHGNVTPMPMTDNNKAGWSFQPPPGNQWLVPVMSPSEGLVYKPYTGSCPPSAGFMAPIYGGYSPLNLPSMGGEFPSPYGIPPSQHQGMGVFPNAPPFTQPYFSPYGMPMMNPVISASSVEHANPYAGSQSRGQAEQISTGEVNFNKDSRTSRNICNQKSDICNQKSDAISSGCPKSQTLKESEFQGSTASSPGERAHKDRSGPVSEGRDALLLFPMAPAVRLPAELADPQDSEQQHARVIKVVPHNPRSATQSVARIFQSIQEERQQY